jgi:hypothetical protein
MVWQKEFVEPDLGLEGAPSTDLHGMSWPRWCAMGVAGDLFRAAGDSLRAAATWLGRRLERSRLMGRDLLRRSFQLAGNRYAIAIAIGLAVWGVSRTIEYALRPARVVGVQTDGSVVVAFNERHEPMWRTDLGSQISAAVASQDDGSGNPMVIVGTRDDGALPGRVVRINNSGGVEWYFDTYPRPFPYSGGHSSMFTVKQIIVDDVFGNGSPHILVLAGDPTWYVNRIALLSAEGVLLGEYFHPGQLGDLILLDVPEKGRKGILASGCNNDLAQVIKGSEVGRYYWGVFLLDCGDIWGQAPPCFGLRAVFGDKPGGSELWYRVMLPQGTSTQLRLDRPAGHDGPRATVAAADGRYFYLDHSGDIVGAGAGDSWRREHGGQDFDTFPRLRLGPRDK